jgi:hypothetical protein
MRHRARDLEDLNNKSMNVCLGISGVLLSCSVPSLCMKIIINSIRKHIPRTKVKAEKMYSNYF